MARSHFLSNTISALLAAFSPAVAIILQPRAGAPLPVPIPSNCTTINPLPQAYCGVGNVAGYAPSPSFQNASLMWASYAANHDASEDAREPLFCFQQCHGLLGCKSAVLASDVPVPRGYYGSPGGQLSEACLLFSEYLDPYSFVAAEVEGQWTGETAMNLYCPR